MDISGATIAKTAVDLVKTDNVLNKVSGLMGMLFPYVGIKQKAVDTYIKDIEQSDLPVETKVFMILNTKKTFKKIKNQKAIAEIAMNNAEQGTNFKEKSGVREEWLDRFMDSAGFVSSEEIQLIWGKILANEFKKPGSTPPNMIRVLSEITPELAVAFRCICSMTISFFSLNNNRDIETEYRQIFVPYAENDDKFRKLGVGFNILNELDALGVIRFDSVVGYISKGITSDKVLIRVGTKLYAIEEYEKGEMPIGNVLLTSVGETLRSITDSIEIEGYCEMVHKYMTDNGVKFADGMILR